ncbi:MAG: grasp-with-spasm system SPASM domain peptide maturase [Bacteroidales bacterium]|jgi:SPASM domain peptide maturase of grasp-with-spasm system|nr:grasp-with-spasm system SPASM domain peptide maturase [Bacteroidales bacterium]
MENFYTHPSCFGITGHSRSIIQDLNRCKYVFAPIWLTTALEENVYLTIGKLRSILKKNDDESNIEDYLRFLIENEIIYQTNKMLHFQKIPLNFETPSVITNSILVFKDVDLKKLSNLVNEFEDLGCKHIQMYIPVIGDFTILGKVLSLFKKSIIQQIELISNYNSVFSDMDKIAKLFSKHPRLFKLYLADSLEDKKVYMDLFQIKDVVFCTEKFDFIQCGGAHPLRFQNNLPFFTESQAHNTCLNRKLCIDAEGNIKNCPVMERSFGNIKGTTLQEAIEKPGFKELWFIHKDQIDVCKDCEFRHMCTDCRCFIKDPENIYSQPAKCTYNPYICKWEGQDGYIPVEECGNYARETGFVPDHEKIKELNKQIWGDDDE